MTLFDNAPSAVRELPANEGELFILAFDENQAANIIGGYLFDGRPEMEATYEEYLNNGVISTNGDAAYAQAELMTLMGGALGLPQSVRAFGFDTVGLDALMPLLAMIAADIPADAFGGPNPLA